MRRASRTRTDAQVATACRMKPRAGRSRMVDSRLVGALAIVLGWSRRRSCSRAAGCRRRSATQLPTDAVAIAAVLGRAAAMPSMVWSTSRRPKVLAAARLMRRNDGVLLRRRRARRTARRTDLALAASSREPVAIAAAQVDVGLRRRRADCPAASGTGGGAEQARRPRQALTRVSGSGLRNEFAGKLVDGVPVVGSGNGVRPLNGPPAKSGSSPNAGGPDEHGAEHRDAARWRRRRHRRVPLPSTIGGRDRSLPSARITALTSAALVRPRSMLTSAPGNTDSSPWM